MSRLRVRPALFRQIQQFIETHLAARMRISDVIFAPPELAPKEHGRRQLHHEIVSGHFGEYTLTMYSTEEEPPLGKIVCTDLRGNKVTGPIDEVTWQKIAAMIQFERAEHVDG